MQSSHVNMKNNNKWLGGGGTAVDNDPIYEKNLLDLVSLKLPELTISDTNWILKLYILFNIV